MKESPDNFKNFVSVIKIMMTISMSTAVVERGFSHMNQVKSSTRTLLGNEALNNVLEVKLNGTSTNDFDPDPAIKRWLNDTKRSRHINGHKTKNNVGNLRVSVHILVNKVLSFTFLYILPFIFYLLYI